MHVAPSQPGPSTPASTLPLRAILIGMWVIAGLAVGVGGAAVWLLRDHAPAAATNTTTLAGFSPAGGEDAASDGSLPVLFDTKPFRLTDQNGRPFDSKQLSGHAWVADFIFTHCVSFCPVMTSSMHEFQQQSAAAGLGGVRMVSFTVDPDRDTPPVLKQYADVNGADLARWSFLTADQKTMWQACRDLNLAVGPGDKLGGAAGMQVMHSSHFLLVDKAGHVRGVYDFKDGGYLKQLVADAKKLTLSEGSTLP